MKRTAKKLASSVSSLLLTGAVVVVAPILAAPAAGTDYGCGFTAGGSGGAIPDLGTFAPTQDLSHHADNDPILDLDVIVNISHTYVGDLELSLSSRGETVLLSSRVGGNGDNYTQTRFDDNAAFPITAGTAPFTSLFRPQQSLQAFDGLDPGGVWTLTVKDLADEDVGTVQSWYLVFTTRWCDDSDRDGVKGSYDSCILAKGVAPHGCPLKRRTIKIAYNTTAKEFRGTLSAGTDYFRCANEMPVRIWRVRKGTDVVVARGYTDTSGKYAIPLDPARGTFYAVAPQVFVEGVAECQRARSTNLPR